LTAGPLLRGIQAVLQELAGSATGGSTLWAGFLWQDGALRAWLPTHHPAALVIVQKTMATRQLLY
jgi:hypothetical protein